MWLPSPLQVKGSIVKASPYTACSHVHNAAQLRGRIALALRGDCMFAVKARRLQEAGATGVIIIGERSRSQLQTKSHRQSSIYLSIYPSFKSLLPLFDSSPSDQREGSNSDDTPLFQMVGDGEPTADITIPLLFLFGREGAALTAALEQHHNVDVLLLPREKQLGHHGEDGQTFFGAYFDVFGLL